MWDSGRPAHEKADETLCVFGGQLGKQPVRGLLSFFTFYLQVLVQALALSVCRCIRGEKNNCR